MSSGGGLGVTPGRAGPGQVLGVALAQVQVGGAAHSGTGRQGRRGDRPPRPEQVPPWGGMSPLYGGHHLRQPPGRVGACPLRLSEVTEPERVEWGQASQRPAHPLPPLRFSAQKSF